MFKYRIALTSCFDEEIYKKSFEYMTNERKDKVIKYKLPENKKQTLLGEWLARNLLCEVSGKSLSDFTIAQNTQGKPQVVSDPRWHISITHSKDTVAAAISDAPIGIDAEEIRPLNMKLSCRFCCDEEIEYIFGHMPTESELNSIGNGDLLKRFLRIWTLKEAYFKCADTKITDFKEINVLKGGFNSMDISAKQAVVNIVTF